MLSPEKLQDVFEYFRGQKQQVSGVWMLYEALKAKAPELLEEDAEWVKKYREKPPEPERGLNPLPVPYLHQQDMDDGAGWRDCFSTTSAMIAEYYGKEPKGVAGENAYNHVREKYGDTTSPQSQLAALRAIGLDAHYATDGTKAKLIALLDSGHPVGCGILHHGHVSAPSGGGHWMLAVGYDDDHVICQDPFGELSLVDGTWARQGSGGELVKYSWKNWLPRWMVGGTGGWYLYCND